MVAAVLIDADDRVLIAQRPEGKFLEGLWEFPGGKVKSEETPEAALIRELREEISIDVDESCLAPVTFASHAYPLYHVVLLVFVCRVWKGRVQSREGQATKWVDLRNIRDYPMPAADDGIVAMLQDYL